MPVYEPSDSIVHTTHGSTFAAFVNPGRGSAELCAWRLTVPANTTGAAHRPDREEILYVLDGKLTVSLDGTVTRIGEGAVVHVPAGALLQIDTGDDDGSAWVVTTPGLTAALPDGSTIAPPWAN